MFVQDDNIKKLSYTRTKHPGEHFYFAVNTVGIDDFTGFDKWELHSILLFDLFIAFSHR